MKRKQSRERRKLQFFFSILLLHMMKTKMPHLGLRFLLLSESKIKSEDKRKRKNRRGLKRKRRETEKKNKWCVEVRLWDSESRRRQCRTHTREGKREFFPLLKQNLVLGTGQSIEFEENKVQESHSIPFPLCLCFTSPKIQGQPKNTEANGQWLYPLPTNTLNPARIPSLCPGSAKLELIWFDSIQYPK